MRLNFITHLSVRMKILLSETRPLRRVEFQNFLDFLSTFSSMEKVEARPVRGQNIRPATITPLAFIFLRKRTNK